MRGEEVLLDNGVCVSDAVIAVLRYGATLPSIVTTTWASCRSVWIFTSCLKSPGLRKTHLKETTCTGAGVADGGGSTCMPSVIPSTFMTRNGLVPRTTTRRVSVSPTLTVPRFRVAGATVRLA